MYVHTMFVMSLVKLRAWNEASEQLDRAIKATVDGSDGPLTPWALRCLQAEIAAGLGREDECINLLYELMSDSRGSNNERRYKETTFVLLAKLVRVGRYKSALSLCNQYLSRFPQDSYAWSQVSRIQMLLGDFPAAQNSIEQQTSRLSSSNKPRGKDPAALLALTNRPAEAMRALETLESETNFANEIAVCQALSGSLSDARRTLESAFRQPPSSVLSLVREAITSNLMTLVGLVPQERDGQEARRRVGAWIAAAAPDDFDLTLASKQSISTL
jgi:tetratricopeptide (TPR) repeat protein